MSSLWHLGAQRHLKFNSTITNSNQMSSKIHTSDRGSSIGHLNSSVVAAANTVGCKPFQHGMVERKNTVRDECKTRTCIRKDKWVAPDSDSFHACATSHKGLYSPFIHSVVSNDSVSGQGRTWSDCADAQSDLDLPVRICPKTHYSMERPMWCVHVSVHLQHSGTDHSRYTVFTISYGTP